MVKPRNLRTEDLAYVKELFWLALDRVRVICIQEAMENFAFPDEIKTKLMKMSDWTFLNLTKLWEIIEVQLAAFLFNKNINEMCNYFIHKMCFELFETR